MPHIMRPNYDIKASDLSLLQPGVFFAANDPIFDDGEE